MHSPELMQGKYLETAEMTAKSAMTLKKIFNKCELPRTVVVLAYDGCQSLDVSGPWEVFTKASKFSLAAGLLQTYQLVLASPQGGPIQSNSGLQWRNSRAIVDIQENIDTILVAGGDIDVIEGKKMAETLFPWLRCKTGSVRRIGSVCTGAFALAAAGLLDGRRATTHWNSCARLAMNYPKVKIEPDAIYVMDPPFYSSAGISAAIDLSLALVEADLGRPIALSVAQELVLYLRRPGGQSQFSPGLQAQMDARHPLRDLVTWMLEHPRGDLSVAALAERMAMSTRHFARQFRAETGETPARFVERLRLDCAKSYLERTPWPLERVAQRAGFGSVDSLQRSLRRHAGTTPELYRQRFASTLLSRDG